MIIFYLLSALGCFNSAGEFAIQSPDTLGQVFGNFYHLFDESGRIEEIFDSP